MDLPALGKLAGLGNGLGRRFAIRVGLARIGHALGRTNAQLIEPVDRLVKHGLIAGQAGGFVAGPNQILFRQPVMRLGGVAGDFELGRTGDGEQGTIVAIALHQRGEAVFVQISDQAGLSRQGIGAALRLGPAPQPRGKTPGRALPVGPSPRPAMRSRLAQPVGSSTTEPADGRMLPYDDAISVA